MRALHVPVLAAVVLAFAPAVALAGTCAVTVAEHSVTVATEPGKTVEKAWTIGRWPARVVASQTKVDGKAWSWDIKVERSKDDAWETIAHPELLTGPGMDGIAETGSRLGPVTVACHD